MESNTNTSRLAVQFGQDFLPESEKISINLSIHFSKTEAQKQSNKIHELTGTTPDTGYALVFALKPTTGNSDELLKHLKDHFEGKLDSVLSKDLTKATQDNLITFNTSTKDYVYLTIQPGSSILSTIEQQANSFLHLGFESLTESQDNNVNINIISSFDFTDLDSQLNSGSTFFTALFRSLKAEILLNLNQGLVPKVLEIVATLEPSIVNSPLFLLNFFNNLQLDAKLASTDELPEYLKKSFLSKYAKNGLSVASTLKQPDQDSFKKFANLIDNGVEIFAVVKNVLAVNIKLQGSGFGAHLIRELSK